MVTVAACDDVVTPKTFPPVDISVVSKWFCRAHSTIDRIWRFQHTRNVGWTRNLGGGCPSASYQYSS